MRPKANSVRLLLTAALLSLFFCCVRESSAQSLEDLARQQRELSGARRARVFTNEDLARPRILETAPPAEAGPAEPLRDSNALASVPATIAAQPEEPFQSAPAPLWSPGTPLGDVARFYRQRKQLRAPLPQLIPEPSEEPVVASVLEPAQPVAPFPSTPLPSPQQPVQKPKRVIANTREANSDKIASASPATVVPARVIHVQTGDSLWKIAGQHLGDATRWREIAAANQEIADPNRIRAGQQLRLPAISATVAAVTAAQAEEQVRVQAGDSLWRLAKTQWGDGQAWSCIADFNPQVGPAALIYPGQVLTLPSLCSPLA